MNAMRVDLSNPLSDGMNHLKNWRMGFSKKDYPVKIVSGLFERQYAMNEIWRTQLDSSFDQYKNTEPDIIKTHQQLEIEYNKALQRFSGKNTLIDLMNKKEDIGGLNYANNIPLILKSQNGDNAATEELEFTYLYYLLCNKATLIWAAFGRKGFSRIDAIAQVTGVIIEYDDPITYGSILKILGQIGVSITMNKLYSPLSKLY
jgi:hypothetical protein